uniref:Uncharacterized protein n=1 Tax=Anguilla anguilla TaxID=7936 RepID=A0A0E9PXV4_ANGAN
MEAEKLHELFLMITLPLKIVFLILHLWHLYR